jgi:sigma-B regulation protein RsbU (phosphoserine phosphatase)
MTEAEKLGSILVVDDEPTNIVVLRGVLGHAGYAVSSASSGPDGLEKARALRPDMILLDVMMPGESGFETCRKLKEDAATAHIPVIFVTSLGELSDKLAGLDLGALDYITKPFIAEEVVARVRSHMNFKRQQGAIIDAQANRLGQVHAAQLALLTAPESVPEARFAVHFLPVLEAGGDFYDVVAFDAHHAAYFLADVSGHDLGASFITSSLKALFRQHAAAGKTPSEILAAMNRILCAITPEEVYLTAVCLELDREAGAYSLSSAGHPPVLARLGGHACCLDLSGPPLGMFESAEYDALSGAAAKGDRFYLYTDGLAENAGRYVTSESFRAALLDSCEHNAVMPLANAVVNLVRDMAGEQAPVDDVVLLGVDV